MASPTICTGLRPKRRTVEPPASIYEFGLTGGLVGATVRRALRCAVTAAALSIPPVHAQFDLLEPERAFAFSARALDASTVEARFAITDGYYLYRDKLRFSTEPALAAGPVAIPAGTPKHDPFFGQVDIYRHEVVVRLPLAQSQPAGSVAVTAESQGCADVGVCYPPQRQRVVLPVPRPGSGPGPVVEAPPPKKSWFN